MFETARAPRMRTRQQFYKLLKAEDPETNVTESVIYRKIKSGEWPSVKAGKKYLLNADVIFDILANPAQAATEPVEAAGQIRRVS